MSELQEWKVVCQGSKNSLILYNSSLQQIRTVTETKSHSPIPWTSPKYFQILADIMTGTSDIPLSLDDFLMNGYFDKFFPVRHKIGSGGCGSVYRVEHVLAGIHLAVYAVKVIPVGELSWLKKVINEVRLLEKLCRTPHPLILGYKHCWMEEWQPAVFGPKIPCLFILMEFAPLGNLESMLNDPKATNGLYRKMDEQQTWQIFMNIAIAVSHLHSLGILHRDLKLSNVLMFEDTSKAPYPIRFVLSDFGTSLDLYDVKQGRMKRTGATGTIETMAPELLVTDSEGGYIFTHSFASDVWSLGVILFSLFYRCNPFTMDGGEELLDNFQSFDQLVADIGLQNAEVPILAKKYMRRMMVRDPQQRISMNEFMGDPEIYNLIVEFGLDNLLKSDGPRVFVVSPSMEDLNASVALALPNFQEEPETEPPHEQANFGTRAVVSMVLATQKLQTAWLGAMHLIALLWIMFRGRGDLEVAIWAVLLVLVEGLTGAAEMWVPAVAVLLYVLYVTADKL